MPKSRRLGGGAIAAAIGGLAASTTFATQVILDLRASDGTHAATINDTGQAIGVDLFFLIAGGDASSLSVQHGIEYLLETQRPDGSWEEELATGSGFPKVFYLNYHLYKDYFPLLALASFVKTQVNG